MKYYNTSAEYQDILVSAMKEAELQLDVTVTVDDLIISKVDAATGKELPGASLRSKKTGKYMTNGFPPIHRTSSPTLRTVHMS